MKQMNLRNKVTKIFIVIIGTSLSIILSYTNVQAIENTNKIEMIKMSTDSEIEITIHKEDVIGDKAKEIKKKREIDSPETIYDLYTQDEIDILCKIVEAEAGDYSEECKINVANVIINRTNSSEFPNTIEEVVYQKGQFQSVTNDRIDEVKVSKETIKAVEKVFQKKDTTKGSLYFMNKNGSTKKNIEWFNNNLTYVMTDESGHSFYK